MTTLELSYEDKRKCEREVLASLFNKFNELSVEMGLSNLQNVHTPYFLCDEMIKKLEEHGGTLKNKTFAVFNFEFIDVLVNVFGVPKENITFFTDNDLKIGLVVNHYNGVNVMKKNFDKDSLMAKNPWGGKTFDCVILNPPYQSDKGSKDVIWDKFVHKSILMIKDNGFLVAIHPSNWRSIKGAQKGLQKELLSNHLHYLEMHDIQDGRETFGVDTRYDWYVMQLGKNHATTKIVCQDIETNINISEMEFIPSGNFDYVKKMIAKTGEKKCEVLFSYSAYEKRQEWMNETSSDYFKYPCVYSILKNGKVNLIYSSTKNNGHFGIPKLICGAGANPTSFIDNLGEYGMTQWAFGIVDEEKNLSLIQKALNTKKFMELNKSMYLVGTQGIPLADYRILPYFRKDFWKEFVNEDGTEK